jgi:hypothetical protein
VAAPKAAADLGMSCHRSRSSTVLVLVLLRGAEGRGERARAAGQSGGGGGRRRTARARGFWCFGGACGRDQRLPRRERKRLSSGSCPRTLALARAKRGERESERGGVQAPLLALSVVQATTTRPFVPLPPAPARARAPAVSASSRSIIVPGCSWLGSLTRLGVAAAIFLREGEGGEEEGGVVCFRRFLVVMSRENKGAWRYVCVCVSVCPRACVHDEDWRVRCCRESEQRGRRAREKGVERSLLPATPLRSSSSLRRDLAACAAARIASHIHRPP